MLNKIDYYLTHDDERQQIALNGYRKVKKFHSYEAKLQKILEYVKKTIKFNEKD